MAASHTETFARPVKPALTELPSGRGGEKWMDYYRACGGNPRLARRHFRARRRMEQERPTIETETVWPAFWRNHHALGFLFRLTRSTRSVPSSAIGHVEFVPVQSPWGAPLDDEAPSRSCAPRSLTPPWRLASPSRETESRRARAGRPSGRARESQLFKDNLGRVLPSSFPGRFRSGIFQKRRSE